MKKDLSRCDDMWSFYFIILVFLNAEIPWKNYSNIDDVAELKF